MSSRPRIKAADLVAVPLLRPKAREPLVEGIQTNHRREWKRLNNGKLIIFALKFMEEKGINGRHELEKADYGLYQTLKKRKLLDAVGFEKKYRNWQSMKDDELINFARKYLKKNKIEGIYCCYKFHLMIRNQRRKRNLYWNQR